MSDMPVQHELLPLEHHKTFIPNFHFSSKCFSWANNKEWGEEIEMERRAICLFMLIDSELPLKGTLLFTSKCVLKPFYNFVYFWALSSSSSPAMHHFKPLQSPSPMVGLYNNALRNRKIRWKRLLFDFGISPIFFYWLFWFKNLLSKLESLKDPHSKSTLSFI